MKVLGARILSALVLAPLALGAVVYGTPAFEFLVVVVVALVCWEWQRLCSDGRFGPVGTVLAVLSCMAALLAVNRPWEALAAAFVAAALVWGLAFLLRAPRPAWSALGALYAVLPAVSMVWLYTEMGAFVLLWLFAVVWATDIGAYAFGRMIGGPLLLPAVSPKKTWAGLFGGMVSAMLVSWVTAVALVLDAPGWLALAALALAVVAQAGDFAESWIKRRFQVKDSSNIIPGHGGVMDRVDGLLAAAPVAAAGFLLWS